MDHTHWGKAHYLDASALVKLVADDPDEEPGRDVLRKYYWQHTASVYATSYCITETFSAFKRKLLRRRITEDQYIKYVLEFRRLVLGVNLRIDEVPILLLIVSTKAERISIRSSPRHRRVTIEHQPRRGVGEDGALHTLQK